MRAADIIYALPAFFVWHIASLLEAVAYLSAGTMSKAPEKSRAVAALHSAPTALSFVIAGLVPAIQ